METGGLEDESDELESIEDVRVFVLLSFEMRV